MNIFIEMIVPEQNTFEQNGNSILWKFSLDLQLDSITIKNVLISRNLFISILKPNK